MALLLFNFSRIDSIKVASAGLQCNGVFGSMLFNVGDGCGMLSVASFVVF